LHSGALVEVKVPGAFVFPTVTLHRSLTDIDLLCSVPMNMVRANKLGLVVVVDGPMALEGQGPTQGTLVN
jgi:hypothetical protein